MAQNDVKPTVLYIGKNSKDSGQFLKELSTSSIDPDLLSVAVLTDISQLEETIKTPYSAVVIGSLPQGVMNMDDLLFKLDGKIKSTQYGSRDYLGLFIKKSLDDAVIGECISLSGGYQFEFGTYSDSAVPVILSHFNGDSRPNVAYKFTDEKTISLAALAKAAANTDAGRAIDMLLGHVGSSGIKYAKLKWAEGYSGTGNESKCLIKIKFEGEAGTYTLVDDRDFMNPTYTPAIGTLPCCGHVFTEIIERSSVSPNSPEYQEHLHFMDALQNNNVFIQ